MAEVQWFQEMEQRVVSGDGGGAGRRERGERRTVKFTIIIGRWMLTERGVFCRTRHQAVRNKKVIWWQWDRV